MKLSDLLTKDMIKVDVQASDWQDAIKKVGSILVKSNKIDEQYIEDMISAVHKFGPYIVLLPGFAFAHAQASDAVHQDCMAMITLDTPVNFNHQKNDPVKCVVAFGTNSEGGHMEIIQSLGTMLMQPKNVEAISNANDVEDVFKVIAEY